ncbi:uncharacterized protein LOC118613555 [Rousettus aegyptiacus]|uniref:uncharacterized protein LOC118613555 n=1 Tax=Rousettus aegyptiacus TaxID=9407 RepID=UPI00168D41C5|nr:uncharacterized protein LOC118613555 [Rousettus aegyptiacus]
MALDTAGLSSVPGLHPPGASTMSCPKGDHRRGALPKSPRTLPARGVGGTLPNSPYETVSTLIHTPDRDSTGGESRRATPAWNTLSKTTDKIRAGRAEGAHRARPHAVTQAGPPEARGWAGARKSIRAAQLSIDYRGSCVNLLRAPTGHFPSHLPSPAAAASTRRHSRAPWLGRVPSVRRRELPALRLGDRIRGDLLLRSAERRRGPELQGDLGGAAS